MDSFKIMPTPEWMGPELRDHKRVDVDIPVHLWELSGDDSLNDEPKAGMLSDISKGGIMVRLLQKLNTRASISARFDLSPLLDSESSQDTVIEVRGLVRQQVDGLDNAILYGIEFTRFIQGNASVIEKIVEMAT